MKEEDNENLNQTIVNDETFAEATDCESIGEKTDEKEKWFSDDCERFNREYPDVDPEELFKDEYFVKFSSGLIGDESLADIYKSYRALREGIEKETLAKAEIEFAKRVSKAKSSPGSLTENVGATDALYTFDELKNMSRKSILADWDKVQRSLKSLKRGK